MFNQKVRNKLKHQLYKYRTKGHAIFSLVYGTFTDDDLISHLTSRLGVDYDILMVHSSFNSMTPMYKGRLNNFLNRLISYCHEHQITLVMPAFYFGTTTYDFGTYYKKHYFDVKKTISQMGLLTELFRRKPGVKRSIHPTHSVCAYGLLAEEITKGHH